MKILMLVLSIAFITLASCAKKEPELTPTEKFPLLGVWMGQIIPSSDSCDAEQQQTVVVIFKGIMIGRGARNAQPGKQPEDFKLTLVCRHNDYASQILEGFSMSVTGSGPLSFSAAAIDPEKSIHIESAARHASELLARELAEQYLPQVPTRH